MSGKVWTSMIFFTTASFIMIHVHHASECTGRDLQSHLYDELLESHWFEMKVFSQSKEEHKLLSLINTLCSNWIENKEIKENFTVVKFFKMMLQNLSQMNDTNNLQQKCVTYTCTDKTTHTIEYINKTAFGLMYSEYCNKSVSDLKCPSEKSITSTTSTISPNVTTLKWTTSLTTEINQNNTEPKFEGTFSPLQKMTITEHVVLAVSLLLNVLFGMWCLWKKIQSQAKRTKNFEMTDMQMVI